MKLEPPLLNRDRLRKLGVFSGVTLAHLLVFAVIGRGDTSPPDLPPRPPFEVFLMRPEPIPPPEPPAPPAETAGGGAPAAPSRIHVPPEPPEVPPELPAPPVPAPEPAVVVGVAPVVTATPGMGQGGEGTGTGTGRGAGSGPGSGSTRERFLRGPTTAELVRVAPRGGPPRPVNVRMRCRIRADSRLEDCRVVEETPPGLGYGPAGLASAAFFRFQPPTEGGRVVEGREITVGVEFPARGR